MSNTKKIDITLLESELLKMLHNHQPNSIIFTKSMIPKLQHFKQIQSEIIYKAIDSLKTKGMVHITPHAKFELIAINGKGQQYVQSELH